MQNTEFVNVMEHGEIVYQNETSKADKNDVQKLMTD